MRQLERIDRHWPNWSYAMEHPMSSVCMMLTKRFSMSYYSPPSIFHFTSFRMAAALLPRYFAVKMSRACIPFLVNIFVASPSRSRKLVVIRLWKVSLCVKSSKVSRSNGERLDWRNASRSRMPYYHLTNRYHLYQYGMRSNSMPIDHTHCHIRSNIYPPQHPSMI